MESSCYKNFVEDRKREQKELNEKIANELKLKQEHIQSKIKVKKTVFQDILPKFFLAKLKEKKEIEVLTGKSQDLNEPPTTGPPPKEEGDPSSTKETKEIGSKKEVSFRNPLDSSPTAGKPKTTFGNLLSGLGFSSTVLKKQAIAVGAGVTLELKDRNTKGSRQIVCAREGFCMVVSRHHFTNQPKDIWVLGGIGSDIITTLDHLNIMSRPF